MSNKTKKSNTSKGKLILAIESSCDETAAAVLEYKQSKAVPVFKTLSSVVKSQIALHSKMGGVVPEVAARAHVKNILPVTEKALADAQVKMGDIDHIAVTAGPGLIPSLIVGVEFAKALAFATGKPLLPINHMAGHLYSPFGREFPISNFQSSNVFPMISLIVSGGHTLLVIMEDPKHYKVIGQTVDDAAGEAFDKVAKLLRLPYPGGPQVSKMAEQGNPAAIEFPRPMIHSKDYNFSFAGLKTAVLYHIRDKGLEIREKGKVTVSQHLFLTAQQNICASFQQAVIDVLVSKTVRAVKEYKAKSVSLSGGVSANKSLREALKVKCQMLNVKFFVPPMSLSTDNAEMIGIAAAFHLNNDGKPVPLSKVKADPNLKL